MIYLLKLFSKRSTPFAFQRGQNYILLRSFLGTFCQTSLIQRKLLLLFFILTWALISVTGADVALSMCMYTDRRWITGGICRENTFKQVHTSNLAERLCKQLNNWARFKRVVSQNRSHGGGGGGGRGEEESRWPRADRLTGRERGVFSEGRGLVLLWLRRPLCHTAYQGSPKSQGLMVSMSPQSSSPALAYCHSCFLISQKQSSVTQTVYLACLPQPGKEKKRGAGGRTDTQARISAQNNPP